MYQTIYYQRREPWETYSRVKGAYTTGTTHRTSQHSIKISVLSSVRAFLLLCLVFIRYCLAAILGAQWLGSLLGQTLRLVVGVSLKLESVCGLSIYKLQFAPVSQWKSCLCHDDDRWFFLGVRSIDGCKCLHRIKSCLRYIIHVERNGFRRNARTHGLFIARVEKYVQEHCE